MSSDNPVEPKIITIEELNQTNMNEFVKIERAEFVSADKKNLTFKVGETELAVYNQWNIDVAALEAGSVYTLTGMGSVYYKEGTVTNQLYLISFEKNNETSIQSVQSSISSAQYYNLSGQPVGENTKGVVIVNGKKIVK